MNHQTLFFSPSINLCILIFFVISETSFAVDFHYQNCSVPTTCGGQNISFPFILTGGQKQPFCGYPGFQLSCNEEDGYPFLRLAGNDYRIHNISYQNQTLIVSNAVFSDSDGCLPLVHNITFPIDRYKLAPNQKEIILLYNCNSSLVDESFSKYKIGCFEALSGSSTSVLALPRDEHQLFNNVSDKCGREAMVAPVEGYASTVGNELGVEVALRRGFMLKWSASNCSRCELSGGECGHIDGYFSCFCPDRPHNVRCQGDG
ncbi:hypothetical protein M0R45_021833 [Rubus argutus]|uniref:non-specific serine/threonine protein kinase n=1 Tax=Rubus argutus TaxID=59490 RepID=A0AAW1XE45_RUBAR